MNRPTLILAVLMAGLRPGQARADGFFDPPAPPPERVAALDALCARLEALGMPAVPPDADWVFCGEKGAWPPDEYMFSNRRRPIPFFGGDDVPVAGNAWRWRPAPDAPAVVLSVYGDVLSASPDFNPDNLPPARLGRATAGLRAVLADATPDPATTTPGPAVLFCAQLHRHGETARAAALLGLLGDAEASATNALGRAQYAALLRGPARTNDLPAFAAALAENLARFPDIYAKDPRPELLAGVRSRIDAEGRPVPGVPEDLQDLAHALDRASADELLTGAFGPAFKDYDVPWFLTEAWTDVFPRPSNVVARIRFLGPRALDLLLPLLRDKTLVDGQWVHSPYDRSMNFTRADAAECILRDILPEPVRKAFFDADPGDARDAALRALVANADAEDRFLFYLLGENRRTPWHVLAGWDGLLLAWLAERAAAGPLPKVEARLEEAIRDVPQSSFFSDDPDPGPPRALCLALFYAAFRGEAGAPFRDRVLALLRDRAASWEPPSGRIPVRDVFGRPDGTVEYRFKDPDFARRRGRAWYAKWAEAFASVPAAPVDSAALADWLRSAVLVGCDDEPLFRPDLDAVPPAPGLLRAVVAPFPRPDDLQTDEERDAGEDGEENPDDFSWYVSLGPGSVTYRSGSSSGEDEYEEEFDDFEEFAIEEDEDDWRQPLQPLQPLQPFQP